MENKKLSKIFAVAQNVLNECVRHKILNILFIFALALIGGALLIEELSPGAQGRTLLNVGYANMELFGFLTLLLSLFIITFEEIEMRTVWLSLTKPVSRSSYFIGKFIGIVFVTLLTLAVMSLLVMSLSLLSKVGLNLSYLAVVYAMALGLIITISFTLAFITIATNLPTGLIFASLLFLLGHLTEHLKVIIANPETSVAAKLVLTFVYYTVPNFALFNLKDKIYMQESGIEPAYLLLITLYALVFCFIFLYIGIKAFEKKEL